MKLNPLNIISSAHLKAIRYVSYYLRLMLDPLIYFSVVLLEKTVGGNSYKIRSFIRRITKSIDNKSNIKNDETRKKLHKKPVLRYLEFRVADNCNLNCKGCILFSNLVKDNIFANTSQFANDMHRLGELFDNIKTIRLLGGEPLLHPELYKIIEICKQVFPDCDLRIVTNAILICQMPEKLLSVIKKYNVNIIITAYKPIFAKISKIKKYLRQHLIRYRFFPTTSFRRNFNLKGDSSLQESLEICAGKFCTSLRNGNIIRCSVCQAIDIFNSEFNLNFPQSGSINLYQSDIDGFFIKESLEKPLAMCRYCSTPVYFDWSQTNGDASLEDWCVKM